MKQNHKELFRKLVQSGEIAELCKRRSTLNIPMRTAGGTAFWESFCTEEGWQLQENCIFGNWRILDPDDKRRAWGITEEQLEAFLNERPTSAAANYLDDGYSFSRYKGSRTETVILIHGWGVRARSMKELAEMLHQTGYSVLNYDYPTSEKNIEDHANIFLSHFREENLQGNIYFLTHSMGGLILRYALSQMTEKECRMIKAIVMLGPPNQGSPLAKFGDPEIVRALNKSLHDMVPGSNELCIPKPPWLPPVGIIAGALDGKVAVESTGLPDGLPFQRIVIESDHPDLRRKNQTGNLILNFFRKKEF